MVLCSAVCFKSEYNIMHTCTEYNIMHTCTEYNTMCLLLIKVKVTL